MVENKTAATGEQRVGGGTRFLKTKPAAGALAVVTAITGCGNLQIGTTAGAPLPRSGNFFIVGDAPTAAGGETVTVANCLPLDANGNQSNVNTTVLGGDYAPNHGGNRVGYITYGLDGEVVSVGETTAQKLTDAANRLRGGSQSILERSKQFAGRCIVQGLNAEDLQVQTLGSDGELGPAHAWGTDQAANDCGNLFPVGSMFKLNVLPPDVLGPSTIIPLSSVLSANGRH